MLPQHGEDNAAQNLPNMALTEPAISRCWVVLYMVTSIRPFLMVSLTLAPSRTEPTVSKMLAKMQACFRVTTPEPTAVPNEFATSLAPTEKASTKAMTKPRISIHRYLSSGPVAGATVLTNSVAAVLATSVAAVDAIPGAAALTNKNYCAAFRRVNRMSMRYQRHSNK